MDGECRDSRVEIVVRDWRVGICHYEGSSGLRNFVDPIFGEEDGFMLKVGNRNVGAVHKALNDVRYPAVPCSAC